MSETIPPDRSEPTPLDDGLPPSETLPSLEAAQAHPLGTLVLEGDFGGQVYVVAPANRIRCAEPTLWQLLSDLDQIAWAGREGEPLPELAPGETYPTEDGASLTYQTIAPGEGVWGGMGGGQRTLSVWVHDEFHHHGLAAEIGNVLAGRRDRISLRTVPPRWQPGQRAMPRWF